MSDFALRVLAAGPAETASYLEIIWTLLALVTLIFHLNAVASALGGYRWLVAEGINGARRIVVRANIRGNMLRALTEGVFLVAGLLALTAPARTASRGAMVSLTIILGFLLIATCNAANTVVERREREALLAKIRAERAGRTQAKTTSSKMEMVKGDILTETETTTTTKTTLIEPDDFTVPSRGGD